MAKLTFKYATMNSGKTIDLIRTAYNYEENGYKTLILKPLVDTKGNNCISSRVGLERKVDYLISSEDNILKMLYKNLEDVKCIFVDEVQFLNRSQIDDLFVLSRVYDIAVICYGLRLNFKMESFEGSQRLLEIADILEELKTICKCGNIARYVGRKIDGEYVTDGEVVVIDGTKDIEYVPLCGDCFLKDVTKIDYSKVRKLGEYNGRRKNNNS